MPPALVDAFLDAVLAQVRWKRWHAAIRQELAGHLEDRIEYLVTARGVSPEDAAREAVHAMGDPIEIGRALDREHRPWRFWLFALVTVFFWGAIVFVAYLLLRDLGLL